MKTDPYRRTHQWWFDTVQRELSNRNRTISIDMATGRVQWRRTKKRKNLMVHINRPNEEEDEHFMLCSSLDTGFITTINNDYLICLNYLINRLKEQLFMLRSLIVFLYKNFNSFYNICIKIQILTRAYGLRSIYQRSDFLKHLYFYIISKQNNSGVSRLYFWGNRSLIFWVGAFLEELLF